LEQQAYLGLLHNLGLTSAPETVNSVWERIPKSLRRDGQLILCYTQILLKQNRDEEAEMLIRDALKAEWQPELVKLYGLVKATNKQKQLETAESWIKSYGNNGVLLLTLGRLCMRNGLWGQARRYLEAAVEAEPDAEAYTELGRLFEHIGEMPEALEQYRKGLLTSTSVVTF
jgi:HemY protein